MVKNTTGGTGTKSLARKHQSKSASTLQLPEIVEYEKFACVTKIFGNGMCQIVTNENLTLIGHIRGKFKAKKNKRHNIITVNSIVLVGLRDMEKPPKNCDLMTIYDDNEIEQLRQLPNINIERLLNLRLSYDGVSNKQINDIDFTNDIDSDDLLNRKQETQIYKDESFIIESEETVNVDDI